MMSTSDLLERIVYGTKHLDSILSIHQNSILRFMLKVGREKKNTHTHTHIPPQRWLKNGDLPWDGMVESVKKLPTKQTLLT